MDDAGFKERIESLDVTLFSRIKAQTTEGDQSSLLAIQNCVRDSLAEYVYLEIGSYLGGSIQPHLLDARCKKIYSIDKRETVSADERPKASEYPGNSEKAMLSLLAEVSPENVTKVECIDSDTRMIPASRISTAPNLCFVDGEHTHAAVIRDFEFCLKVCAANATIVFHDTQIVFRGVRSAVSRLRSARRRFSGHYLLDVVFAVCLDESPVAERLARFSGQVRKNDLWSPRNDLRLLKWRARRFKERASSLATNWMGRNEMERRK